MAKQTIINLVDDLDGTKAEDTVSFALDGVLYSIDLSLKNAKRLREFLSEYADAGERVGRVGSPAQLTRAKQPQSVVQRRDESASVRRWAADNGFEVSERGRIPVSVIEAYTEAHNARTVVASVKKASGAKTVSFSK